MKRQKVRNNDYGYTKLSGKDSDGSGEETELFVKKSNRSYKEIPTIDKIIQEGDTLQALSIKYRCSIAELKRLNNIHKENEIFARNTIKVPAHPFTTALAGVHDSGDSSPNGKIPSNEIDQTLLENRLQDTFNVPSMSGQLDFNTVIFNSNIVVNKYCDNENLNDGQIDEEEVRLLPIVPLTIQEPVVSRWSCSGADADISWITLILCIIVVIFAVPLLYVVYVYEHPKEFYHKHPEHI